MCTPSGAVGAVPPPERLRDELVELYRVVRNTRSLLRLSERIHGRTAARREVSHATR